MIEGIIYKYTSPSGKSYIGQTTNEAHRRSTWLCTTSRYAGPKIDRARAKYGPENFIYEVLHKKYYFTSAEATQELDKWETYYIGYYDTYKNGYNSTIGGLSNRGIKRSKETIEKLRKAGLGRIQSKEERMKRAKALKGTKHSEAASLSSKEKRRMSGRLKTIYQFTLSGILIKKWRCVAEAADNLGIVDKNIYRAIKSLGTYKGYYWRDNAVLTKKPIKTNAKTVYKKTINGDIVETFPSIKEAANNIGKSPYLLSKCLNNKRETAYGFIWTFNR